MRSVHLTCLVVDILTIPLGGSSAARMDELTAFDAGGAPAAHAAGRGTAGTTTGGPTAAAGTVTICRLKISVTRGGRDWALHRAGGSKEVEWRPEDVTHHRVPLQMRASGPWPHLRSPKGGLFSSFVGSAPSDRSNVSDAAAAGLLVASRSRVVCSGLFLCMVWGPQTPSGCKSTTIGQWSGVTVR